MLRLPDGMRDKVAEAAKAENRSMNSEIVLRLQASFDKGATKSPVGLPDAMDEMTLQIGALLLRDVLRHIPPELQNSELIRTARDFSNGVVHGDTLALGKALATLLLKKPEDIQRHNEFMEYMGTIIAAKERGEDMEPYRQADLERMRSEVQSKSAVENQSKPAVVQYSGGGSVMDHMRESDGYLGNAQRVIGRRAQSLLKTGLTSEPDNTSKGPLRKPVTKKMPR